MAECDPQEISFFYRDKAFRFKKPTLTHTKSVDQGLEAGDEPPRKGQVDRSGVAHVYQHELDAGDELAELGGR